MRVLHICNDYYNTGIYRNIHYHLLKKDIESYMFVPTQSRSNQVKIEENGVIREECFNYKDRFHFHRKQRKITNSLVRLVDNVKPDIIHSYFVFSGGYSCLELKKELGIPYVVMVQNTDLNVFFGKMPQLRKIGVDILLNAESVIFLSSAYRDELLKKYVPNSYRIVFLEKSIVVPFGIDSFWLMNVPDKSKRFNNQKVKVITVGTINKNKNQTKVVAACRRLREKGYEVEYVLVGRIENRRVFNNIINRRYTKYLGEMSKEDLLRQYQESDIMVLPSRHESFGLVYAEAISQGLPIIYSRGQGFDGQFAEGTVGFSVDYRNIKDIVSKILTILMNYNDISEQCIKYSAKFNWSDIVTQYISIYYTGIRNKKSS